MAALVPQELEGKPRRQLLGAVARGLQGARIWVRGLLTSVVGRAVRLHRR